MIPGIYSMAADAYHADPCPEPSLSSGVAKLLVRRSPLHARAAHPRMGGEGMEPTKSMDEGSILHRLILGAGDEFEALPFDSYTTKAAREARDEARAAGRVPVLADDLKGLELAACRALEQMREHPDLRDFFAPGKPEAVVAWQEDGAWFRCMVDWMPDHPRAPWFDIKTVAQSAAPVDFQRSFIKEHAFQRAFYLRGAKHVQRFPRDMLFIAIERKGPNAIASVTAAQSMEEVAAAEVERAASLWKRCLKTDEWPGYPAVTAHISAPNWMTAAEELAALAEEECHDVHA